MTFSDCWIRKIGEAIPEDQGEAFHRGRIKIGPWATTTGCLW
ncbi:MAG TPA: hypothetical protein VIJ94_01555 [Caulobacteraceae bacterium]